MTATALLAGLGLGALVLAITLAHLRGSAGGRRTIAALVVGGICTVAGAGMYLAGSNIGTAERLALYERDPAAAMAGFADDLESRLADSGDDAEPQGYFLLGRARGAAGDTAGAIAAYARANALSDEADPDLLVAEAEARLGDRNADPRSRFAARQRIEQALATAPEHPAANFFAAALAIGRGDEADALPHLRIVLDSDLLQGEAREGVRRRVAQIEASLGDGAPAGTGADSAAAAEQGGIAVTVTLADGVSLPDTGTLFLFVREADGPPMPLAAKRIDAPRFPVAAHITDADRLRPGPDLRTYDQLLIGARWSASGDALAGRDGPEASVRVAPGENAAVSLTLGSRDAEPGK
ncbi:hypothetical protein [Algiphilus sp.]|uniref:c-type cytochrome biogenesis protein CcmI/CycH n=1 Tax=Algiphilus sp. TaxID=1872431 RepID=UPI0025B94A9D|nr:hypothetical protein [Algiphilus sp.]MCK5772073.1 hypothetical protein [Algiphilus sp.]